MLDKEDAMKSLKKVRSSENLKITHAASKLEKTERSSHWKCVKELRTLTLKMREIKIKTRVSSSYVTEKVSENENLITNVEDLQKKVGFSFSLWNFYIITVLT